MRNHLTILFCLVSINVFAQTAYTDPMKSKRSGHTLTHLINGNRVLAVGGYDQTKNLRTAEIYAVGADTWTETDSMEYVRYTHTANILPNDNVLVTGGWDGGSVNYNSTEIFNSTSDTWSMGPDMAVGRSGHTATTLGDGKILIVGGYTGSVNTDIVEIYDPAADTIYIVDTLTQGRSYHTATLMSDGKVLICGGYNPNFGFQMKSVEIYDPATGKITAGPDMLTARDYHSAILLNDGSGKVMVTGGREFTGTGYIGITKAEYYNPSNNQWVGMSDMPAGQSYHEMFTTDAFEDLAFYSASIILIGGVDKSGGLGLDSAASYVYNIADDVWKPFTFMKSGGYEMRSVKYYPLMAYFDAILLTGGADNTAEKFEWIVSGGVKDQANKKAFSIAPNPSSSIYYIELKSNNKDNSIQLLNSIGQKVQEIQFTGYTTLDLSSQPKGMYVAKITSGNNVYIEKLFLE